MTGDFSGETPGQLLRTARLARGFDLATAHEGTKIPLRLLEALERDDYHQISDMLYAKSFLRNYASWLELDTEQVLKYFEMIAGDLVSSQHSSAPVWSEDQVTVRRIGVRLPRLLQQLLAALLALVILSLVWVFWLRGPGDASLPVRDMPVAPATLSEMGALVTPTAPGAREDMREVEAMGALALNSSEGRARALELPTAVRGDPRLQFVGGEMFDLVLRIRLPADANCTVKRGGQSVAMPLIWPEEPIPLPAANIRHGLAYAVRDGFVAYWGTGDNFTVTLEDLQGVEVTLNGKPQEVDLWRPGQPFMLHAYTLDMDGGRR